MPKTIELTKGKKAIVSDQDYETLSKTKWSASLVDNKRWYAVGWNLCRKVYMHRLILRVTAKNVDVDHINGDTLDNRRENLRIATRSQNNANSRLSTRSTSGFKGVSFDKRRLKWGAYIKSNGKHLFLGYFATAEEAAAAYDAKAVEVHGEYAKTNSASRFISNDI